MSRLEAPEPRDFLEAFGSDNPSPNTLWGASLRTTLHEALLRAVLFTALPFTALLFTALFVHEALLRAVAPFCAELVASRRGGGPRPEDRPYSIGTPARVVYAQEAAELLVGGLHVLSCEQRLFTPAAVNRRRSSSWAGCTSSAVNSVSSHLQP